MSELKFKSKDSFNIKSKPRLYFSCHPSDFNYFDKIAISILKQYDCVIYYNDYVDVNVDELLYQLDQMQLIIVPITRNFLLESNVALDIEFKYAVEKHIPILPLMFENRLVNIYQEKCGDTQFLDVTSNDETAISFQKKVEELFEAVILKDDMMNKVREAFDAYVFLSYRKKDRQLSQELMNLIHSDEDLRDVAIWYDEFLLPGENFNDEIKSMLSKSDLFLLLVTPNLVEENNYVMKIEYPFAKSINLPVVAVEANETDSNILKKYFEQMPSLLNFLNKKVIVESIIKNIDKISLAKDETPEHTYLIGLAYLKGIDVEVNRKKGLDLILEAANKNYINAIKEMIKIYLNGIGVEKDINKVLYWQGKLMDYYAENETTIKYSYSENSDEYINYYKEYFYDKVYILQ